MIATRVVQLSDTHIVAPNERYHGVDSAAYLIEAIDAVNALDPAPTFVAITGDLVNGGRARQYERFRTLVARLRAPHVVIAGNHDDRAALRATLDPETFGDSTHGARIDFAIDGYPVRFIGLDATRDGRHPGGGLEDESLAWLDATLATRHVQPTILAIHQPPFRTGLHYLDVFGFRGGTRLRRTVERHRQIGLVMSGHIHCVRTATWGGARLASAPSTAPQMVPELFERRVLALRRETPGFAVHDWRPTGVVTTAIHRRTPAGAYVVTDDGRFG